MKVVWKTAYLEFKTRYRATYRNKKNPPTARMRFVVRNQTALTTTFDLSHRSCIVISSLPGGEEVGGGGAMAKEITPTFADVRVGEEYRGARPRLVRSCCVLVANEAFW